VEKIIRFQIADIHFQIYHPEVAFYLEMDDIWREFSCPPSHREAEIQLRIYFPSTSFSKPENCQSVYSNDRMWTLHREGEIMWVENKPPGSRETLWLARANMDFSEVDLFFREEFREGPALLNNVRYPLLQIILMHYLGQRQQGKGALIHSAGCSILGKGCIFPGVSGAGKSTLTRQLKGMESFRLFSDDRMMVRKINGKFHAFGTPWPGDAGVAVNESAPLAAIIFIARGRTNQIRPLPPLEAIERLVPVTSIPWYERDAVNGIMDILDDLLSQIPVFELCFQPNVEVAGFLKNFIDSL